MTDSAEQCKDASKEPLEIKIIAAVSDGTVRVTPEKCERIKRLVDTHTDALVGAAYEACTAHRPEPIEHLGVSILACECGNWDGRKGSWSEHIRSLAPEAATRELERRVAEARLEGQIAGRKEWVSNLEAARDVAIRQLAELEAAAKETP